MMGLLKRLGLGRGFRLLVGFAFFTHSSTQSFTMIARRQVLGVGLLVLTIILGVGPMAKAGVVYSQPAVDGTFALLSDDQAEQ